MKEYLSNISTNLLPGLNPGAIRHIDYDNESLELGLVPQDEKVTYLEGLMLRRIQSNQPIDDVVAAIKVLKGEQPQTIEMGKTFGEHLNSLIFTFLLWGLLAVGLSYSGSFFCGASRSQFCQKVNTIPDSVSDLLREPTSNPNPVQPKKLP